PLADLDQAFALVEGDVRQGAHGDRQRGVAATLGGVDDDVRDPDQLLLDGGGASGLGGHGLSLRLRRHAGGHRALDAVGCDDDRVRQTFGTAAIAPHELVGPDAARQLLRHLLQLIFQLGGGQATALEAVARLHDLFDVQLEDVAPAEFAVRAL